MKTKWVDVIIMVLLLGIVILMISFCRRVESPEQFKIDSLEVAIAKRDGVIVQLEKEINQIQLQRDSIKDSKRDIEAKLDSSIYNIKTLTKPKVTKKEVEEALRWAESQ
jgi:cytochrome c-type biogenesis protein CcmH/NrfF